MHDSFEQFAAFNQDAIDNKALLTGAGQDRHSRAGPRRGDILAPRQAEVLRFAASDVTAGIVQASGRWVMEETHGRPSGWSPEYLRQ